MSWLNACREFPTTPSGWEALKDWVTAETPPALLAALMVCLDELFVNCRRHGRADCVSLGLQTMADTLEITWKDDGAEFDPIAWLAQHRPTGAPDKIGGSGLFLVAGLARNLTYSRTNLLNDITFSLSPEKIPTFGAVGGRGGP